MFFVLDGDRSADRAHVMQADVPTAGELELARLHQTVVERAPSPTAWGVGIRAYAPLSGPAGKAGAYVGITMSAARYYSWVQRVYHTAALGWLVALALAILAGVRMARVEGTRLRAETEIANGLKMAADAADARREIETRSQGRQKLEALGTLAGGVAHDFNNMLTVILGNAEVIAAEASAGSDAGVSAEAIQAAALRARDVVRRILLFSRPEAEARTSVALGPAIDETVQLLAATMPRSVTVVWQRPAQPVTAVVDPSQLAQVLMNLGVNASQALPNARGTIEFRLDLVEMRPIESARLGLQTGSYARIEVCDDGAGMSEDVRARIFEPFFTTKTVGEGTGLGLSVVEGVVRGHRGAVDVRSTVGGGTTFTIYLPAIEPVTQTAQPSKGAMPASAHRAEGQRVLLVDDEPMVLTVEAQALRRAGYDVDVHGDVDAALNALAADSGAYDGLVTDRTMPKRSGLDLARQARALHPRLPIVLLTGRSEPGDAESPYITLVLGKPASAAALMDAVERAVARTEAGGDGPRGPVDSGVART